MGRKKKEREAADTDVRTMHVRTMYVGKEDEMAGLTNAYVCTYICTYLDIAAAEIYINDGR